MMLGESHRANPTIHVPPWPVLDDTTADMYSPYPVSDVYENMEGNANRGSDYSPLYLQETLAALQRYLPSNDSGGGVDVDSDSELSGRESDAPMDAYSCDQFRMFEFKVRKCARGRSHDWTECPYAHPGEKARRRDPRKYHYSGTACPDFRKGNCKKDDACEFAHGVFECWLHPARYRTQPCKDGTNCRRRVCFFAHTPEQLRLLPQQSPRSVTAADSYDAFPLRQPFVISPSAISPPPTPPADSPPMSPITQTLSRSLGSNSVHDVMSSLRNLQLGKVKSFSPRNVQIGSPGFGSPRGSILRPGFSSMPSTPTQVQSRQCLNYFDAWDQNHEEEPPMERVESGRDIRAKMFEKLSKENSLERPDLDPGTSGPNVEWVSDLVK